MGSPVEWETTLNQDICAMRPEIHLHEEVLLLALRDQKGTLASSDRAPYAIAGAILAEMLLSERAVVDEEGKKSFLRVIDETPFDDPILDECLGRVVEAKRRAKLEKWVERFAKVKKLHHRVAQGLCRKRVLRADEDKVLFIFNRKIYPELDPKPEREILGRLEKAIFSESRDVDPRTVVVLSLARSTDLLKANFDKDRLKRRKKRIEKVVNGDVTGRATKQAIDAMQAAVMAAVIIPAVVTTTVTTST